MDALMSNPRDETYAVKHSNTFRILNISLEIITKLFLEMESSAMQSKF